METSPSQLFLSHFFPRGINVFPNLHTTNRALLSQDKEQGILARILALEFHMLWYPTYELLRLSLY